MVIAQYRHPNYDLYKRSIMGRLNREDEPAVYRALEEGAFRPRSDRHH